MNRSAGWMCVAVSILLTACAYKGGGIDDPVVRKFSYFSYLNGDDLRTKCQAGSAERYRLVYNADYEEQVRHYELVADASGGASLAARITGRADLARGVTAGDLLEPWRGTAKETWLDRQTFAAFTSALAESGFREPTPAGLELPSDRFYWIAMGCRDGRFHYSAWLYPSPRAERLTFPGWLFGHDPTGVRVKPVTDPVRPYPLTNTGDNPIFFFNLKVGKDGLVGVPRLF